MFSKGLILASTSRYRRALLERLGLPFDCVAPDTDETRVPGEPAAEMALRLARAKAEAVAAKYPAAIVIGSDQVALRGTDVLGKPGTVERCRKQLRASSGKEVVFLTAVHVIDGAAGRTESHVDRTVVKFRELSDAEIDRYIERDQPLDCAGGFKAESLGIALFDRIESIDPTGLTGLPLSWLCGALRRARVQVP
ncbi:MAG: Maf family nucleotide pyrophosphatase [Gammaproteobacteria bacterium]|nr:Maf family nucleotide pyrophosphatase [Gammaproteobacteria bacterium]MDH5274474.1 Maf family nucleotide pyrophosphatase [Gammaproteobacteria bacterium]